MRGIDKYVQKNSTFKAVWSENIQEVLNGSLDGWKAGKSTNRQELSRVFSRFTTVRAIGLEPETD